MSGQDPMVKWIFQQVPGRRRDKLGVSLYTELYYAPFYKSLLLKVAATDLSTILAQFFL